MIKKILCFLTLRPCELFYDFCKKLQNENYDVYIFIDDNNYNIPNCDNVIKVIKINNEISEGSGFKSTVLSYDNKATSRDKALYYFCRNNIDYEYIWFMEEDVFIPSIHTIENIDNKYANGDYLVSSHNVINEKRTDWHWNYINQQIRIDPPYASAMICAIRCSRKLLECINDYVIKYNNLFMDEALFNTISLQNNLDIKIIPELSTIYYRHDWRKEDISQSNLYHPIKSIITQYEYRI